jgi:hypothetical protein
LIVVRRPAKVPVPPTQPELVQLPAPEAAKSKSPSDSAVSVNVALSALTSTTAVPSNVMSPTSVARFTDAPSTLCVTSSNVISPSKARWAA